MRTAHLLFVIIGLTLLFACQSNEPYTIEQKDGYTLVHNHSPLHKTSPISVEFVRQYGSENPVDGEMLLGEPMGVTADDAGAVYILDHSICQIIKCSPDGDEILRFGKKGQGPQEMMMPYWPTLIEGMIYVPDFAGVVHRFTTDGKYAGRSISPVKLSILTMRDAATMIVNLLAESAMGNDTNLLHLYTTGGDLISTFCHLTPHAEPEAATLINRLDVSTDLEGNIIVAFLAQNRLEKYDRDGNLILKIKRESPCEEFIRKAGKHPQYGHMQWEESKITYSMQIDHKNRIWLISYTRQPEHGRDYNEEEIAAFFVFDVFDENGIHLYSLDFPPESFNSFRIIGDRMFFIDPRARGVVREYRIKDSE